MLGVALCPSKLKNSVRQASPTANIHDRMAWHRVVWCERLVRGKHDCSSTPAMAQHRRNHKTGLPLNKLSRHKQTGEVS